MPTAEQMIISQQKAMSRALLAVRTIARKALRSQSRPDFLQLKRLMTYVERFPEKLHQLNEERHLFRALEAREPALGRIIARLRRDHSAMKGYGARLRTALGYWEQGDPKAGPEAANLADDYARFCRQHARVERGLLPAALGRLSAGEWRQIEHALEAAADPLANSKSRDGCSAAIRQMDIAA